MFRGLTLCILSVCGPLYLDNGVIFFAGEGKGKAILRPELRASCMPSKGPTTELYPQLHVNFILFLIFSYSLGHLSAMPSTCLLSICLLLGSVSSLLSSLEGVAGVIWGI